MKAALMRATVAAGESLLVRGWRAACAESCTGGLIARQLTELPGSSVWFDRGFVTYSNVSKCEMLGVPGDLIEGFGAVSQQVAQAMVMGVLVHSHAQFAMAVTGIAGPSGGTESKPVGLVWFGFCVRGEPPVTIRKLFEGDRGEIRTAAALFALEQLATRTAIHGDIA
jgi:nicotinamide-nucleotide amidase